MGQKVKQAKMANRAKAQVATKLPEGTHRHRCPDCGEFWMHNDPKCMNILLCYMLCTVCSSKEALSGVVEGDEK